MEGINYVAWKFWAYVVHLAATAAIGVYAWWQTRQSATREAIDSVHDKVGEVTRRVDRCEQSLEHLPGNHDLAALDRRIDELNAQLGALAEAQRGTNHLLHVIHEHLLKDRT